MAPLAGTLAINGQEKFASAVEPDERRFERRSVCDDRSGRWTKGGMLIASEVGGDGNRASEDVSEAPEECRSGRLRSVGRQRKREQPHQHAIGKSIGADEREHSIANGFPSE